MPQKGSGNDSLQVLMSNFQCTENTFLYRLREELYFDWALFWEYYNSVRDIVRQTMDQPLDRDISRAVSFTYAKILELIVWDYSDTDLVQIDNFPFDKLPALVERLGVVVDGYFQGYLVNEEKFGEELQNPLFFKETVESQPPVIQLGFYKEGLDLHAVGFRNEDGAYDIYLNEEDDKMLVDSRLSRGEAQGRFLFTAADSSRAYRIFHEWVMKNYTPYSTNQ